MNKFITIGNLTKDPELSSTTSGVSVCKFSIAVSRPYTNSEGERETDFFNCVAWRGQGENIAKYCKKGSKIAIEGSVQNRSYDAQDGTKRYVTEILVNSAEFISSPKNDDGTAKTESTKTKVEMEEISPDELPF